MTGGGIYVSGSSNFNIDGLELGGGANGNSAGDDGGGMYVISSTLSLDNVTVQNNSATDDGGGLFVGNASDVSIFTTLSAPTLKEPEEERNQLLATSCTPSSLGTDEYCSQFLNNTTGLTGATYGGAIHMQDGSILDIKTTAFINNIADFGGAVYSLSAGDNLTMENNLFTSNVGSYVLRVFGAGTLLAESNTFAGNPATAIGISNVGASPTFNNNIVWGNSGGTVISPAVVGTCNNSQDNSLPGISSDPMFITTTRGDYRLDGSSPSVDVCASGPSIDLDNFARPKGSNYDMGAFESCPALGSTPSTIIEESGTSVKLSWTADPAASSYNVYRDTSPYYTPGAGNLRASGVGSPWLDSAGTIGNPATNYYYYLGAMNCGELFESNHVGEFDFAIVPGTP